MKRFLFLLLALLLPASAPAQTYKGQELVRTELLADTTAIVPGQPFLAAVRYRIAPRWHLYWQYPGDSGLAPDIKWDLPPGFTAAPVQWPVPHRHTEPGDLEVYIYSDELLLAAKITPPENFPATEKFTLRAKLTWLVCENVCVPGKSEVALELPAGSPANAQPANSADFLLWQARLPLRAAASGLPWKQFAWSRTDKEIRLEITAFQRPAAPEIDFYPLPPPGLVLGHPKLVSAPGQPDLAFTIPILSDENSPPVNFLPGIVVSGASETDRTAWTVETLSTTDLQPPALPLAPAPSTPEKKNPADAEVTPAPSSPGPPSLLSMLLFAFLGGIILNVMPCVLPALSLKIFGFIEQAGQEPRRIFRHGLAFSSGVLVFFLLLASGLLLVRASTGAAAWGIQFQSPAFLLGLSAVVLLFALNLFGLFEITLPGPVGQHAAQLAARDGYLGSFLHGGLATLLATPCTAPYMGFALGFAFLQPAPAVLAIFAALAAGMSLPYLLLSANPALIRRLPRPGAWMLHAKQGMGLLLLATLVWLLSLHVNLTGPAGLAPALALLLALATAAWLLGLVRPALRTATARRAALAAALLLPIATAWLVLPAALATDNFARPAADNSANSANSPDHIPWATFTPAAVLAAQAAGRPILVDFTADWCLSCKVNERVALDIPSVRQALRDGNFLALRADWTRSDPAITAALRSFDRAGVPLCLVYPPVPGAPPEILPEILTPGIVLDALARAQKLSTAPSSNPNTTVTQSIP